MNGLKDRNCTDYNTRNITPYLMSPYSKRTEGNFENRQDEHGASTSKLWLSAFPEVQVSWWFGRKKLISFILKYILFINPLFLHFGQTSRRI